MSGNPITEDHADLGPGATHFSTPEEYGCWFRLVAKLTIERDEARAEAARARREGAEAMREAAAQACKAVYRDHKRSKSYPVDMGGLAEECEAAVRALPLPGDDK